MPDNVVDQVHRMARQQRANPGLMFGIRSTGGVDYEDVDDSSDDDEDDEYVADDMGAEGSEDVEDENGPRDYEDTGSIESESSKHAADDAVDLVGIDMNTEVDANRGQTLGGDQEGMPATRDMEEVKKEGNNNVESEGVNGHSVESEGVDGPDNNGIHRDANDMEKRGDDQPSDDRHVGTVEERDDTDNRTGYNLRRNRERSYKHLYDPKVFSTKKGDDDEGAIALTMTNEGSEETGQMSMKKGLKVFGEPGYATVKKEMQQLHDRKVMQPVNRKDLSPSQKKEALGYLICRILRLTTLNSLL